MATKKQKVLCTSQQCKLSLFLFQYWSYELISCFTALFSGSMHIMYNWVMYACAFQWHGEHALFCVEISMDKERETGSEVFEWLPLQWLVILKPAWCTHRTPPSPSNYLWEWPFFPSTIFPLSLNVLYKIYALTAFVFFSNTSYMNWSDVLPSYLLDVCSCVNSDVRMCAPDAVNMLC